MSKGERKNKCMEMERKKRCMDIGGEMVTSEVMVIGGA
jgi:hypothetical protein